MKFITLGLLSIACLETSFAGKAAVSDKRVKPAKTRFGFPIPSELLLPKSTSKNRFGFPMPSELLLPKNTRKTTPRSTPKKTSISSQTQEKKRSFVLPNGQSFNPSEHTNLAKKREKIDDQIGQIELFQPRRAHRPANPEKESMLKKTARNAMKNRINAIIMDSSFIKSDSTIRLKNNNSTCFGGVLKSKKGSIVVHGDCEVLNATRWSYGWRIIGKLFSKNLRTVIKLIVNYCSSNE